MLPIGYLVEVFWIIKYIFYKFFLAYILKKNVKVLFLLKTFDSRSFGYK